MKGMLIKDLRLLKNQRQYFLSILFIALIFAVTGQNLYFVIGYCTFIVSLFSISTISYDEHNNGFFYLFTMPISRRGYALEKYLFVLSAGGGMWAVVTAAAAAYTWMRTPEMNMGQWIIGAAAEFFIIEAMIMLMLPVQLKFGAEKSRMVTMIFSFGIFGGVMAIAKVMKITNFNFGRVSEINPAAQRAVILVGFVIITLISMATSVRIMEKKRF